MKLKKMIQNNIEKIIILISGMIVLLGIVFEVSVKRGHALFVIPGLNDISLTILQIQASLTTLIIAVIALLSGSISESYMGISISHYYLEIKPHILKYKSVIVVEFLFLGFNLIATLLAGYNVVIAIFTDALIFIVYSIFEIYSLFKGRNNTQKRIEEYIIDQFQNGSDYLELGNVYVDDWKKICSNQSVEEYDKYFDIYIKLVLRQLSEGSNTEKINSLSENLVLFFLKNENCSARIKGVYFISDYYEQIWRWANNNREKSDNKEKQIHLIDRVSWELYSAINSFDSETFNNVVEFKELAEMVIRVESSLGYDEGMYFTESRALFDLARTLGGIINKHKKNNSIIETQKWEKIFHGRYDYFVSGIPDVSRNHFMETVSILDFNICYGYLLKGQLDMVKNAVFLDDIGKGYRVDNRYYVIKVLMIHCFMYYLAFREHSDCIEADLQNSIRAMLTDPKVVHAIFKFARCFWDNAEILTDNIEDEFEKNLKQYELFPRHLDGKIMIMEGVVREYFMYFVLFNRIYMDNNEIIGKTFDLDRFTSYLFGNNAENVKSHFNELHQIFELDLNEEDRIQKTERMFLVFESEMKRKYKKNVIKRAVKVQKKFDKNNSVERIKKKIIKKITKRLNGWFYINKETEYNETRYKNVWVFRSCDYTRFIRDKKISDIYSVYPLETFIKWLVNELKKTFNAKTINRNAVFTNDKEFRDFLQNNGYTHLVGSQYVFKNSDFQEKTIHTEFLNERQCNFVLNVDEGIAIKEDCLFIKLNGIKVDIKTPSLEDIPTVKDDRGLIQYSPVDGLSIGFEENELRNFIHDEMKIINIFFDLTIGIQKNVDSDSYIIITRK